MKNTALTKLIFCLLLTLASASVPQAYGQSSEPNEDAYITDGPVQAIALTSDRVFLGGDFDHVGAYSGGGVPLSAATGKPAAVYPKINGVVYSCIADGKGGWFVGGWFDKVGYLPRKNLAHVLSTGRVDEDFNVAAEGTVHALALSGSTLYVGGQFTTIGGQARNHIAAVNLLTGAVNPAWDANANDDVYALAAPGTIVYAGGRFESIGGKTRHRVAALSTATGAASIWDAKLTFDNIAEEVRALAASGSTVYVGGFISYVAADGKKHGVIAAFDATSGAVKDWNPPISNGPVNCMSLSASTLYIGGSFTLTDAAGYSKYACLAALDTASGQFRDVWPNANHPVYAVLASGTKVFVGGQFSDALPGLDGAGSTLGAAKRNYLASIDIATGAVSSWDPNPDGAVYALAASGSMVFAGGNIRSVNTQNRTGLAALDAVTGEVTNWNPVLSRMGLVKQLVVFGSTLYVEGAFTSIGGQARNSLGAVDLASGAPTAWNPPQITYGVSSYDNIKTMAVAGGKIFVGGSFTQVGAEEHKYLVALDPATGAVTGSDLAVDNTVFALAASGSTLYAGGDFTSIGGQARSRIAALDAASGSVTAWNPTANSFVYALAADGSQVYAAGEFSAIGGQARQCLAALDPVTGKATSWNPGINLAHDDPFYPRLALSGPNIFVFGHFSTINGDPRSTLAALGRAIPATTLPWVPKYSSTLTSPYSSALAASDTAVYVGSWFKGIGGTNRPYFAKFDISPNPARLALSSTSLDFLKGTRYAVDVERGGAPTTRTLTLTNAGSNSLVFTGGDAATPGLAITGAHAGDFKILSVRPSTLTPLEAGESVTVTVQFAPSAARRTLGLDAMLEVRSDSPITPDLYIPLTGDAVPVKLSGFAAE